MPIRAIAKAFLMQCALKYLSRALAQQRVIMNTTSHPQRNTSATKLKRLTTILILCWASRTSDWSDPSRDAVPPISLRAPHHPQTRRRTSIT